MTTLDTGVALLRLVNGAAAAQSIIVAARLGLADLLARNPADADSLAAATNTHAPSLWRLLRALAALGIIAEEPDGRFVLAPLGHPLQAGVPGSMRDLVLLFGHPDFWATWGELEHCVRTGETAVRHLFGTTTTFERYAADPAFGAVFDAGMAVLAERGAAAVLAAWSFPEDGLVVDVGGGQGALLVAILRARPGLRGIMLDLPGVAERAARVLRDADLADRARAEGGDMFAGVPPGAELYLLKSVLHDWDDDRASDILRACRTALTLPSARLLVIERVMPERMAPEPAAVAQAMGDLMMLTRAGGRERTETEFRDLLDSAGLRLVRVVPTASHYAVLEAVAS
jgi:hypothetical protein